MQRVLERETGTRGVYVGSGAMDAVELNGGRERVRGWCRDWKEGTALVQ